MSAGEIRGALEPQRKKVVVALEVAALLPAVLYLLVVAVALLLGAHSPFTSGVRTFLENEWRYPTFLALVLGGPLGATLHGLLAGHSWTSGDRFVRVGGWCGVALLLINLALLPFHPLVRLADGE